MGERVPMKERFQEKIPFDLSRLFDPETVGFLNLYRRRGWVFSYFALLFLAVPVYLFMKAIHSFSGISVLELFLCLLLLILWAGMPLLFVFYNSRNSSLKRIWAWVWVALAVASCIFWGIVLPD